MAGVVLYLNERSYNFEDRLYATTVDHLWTSSDQPHGRRAGVAASHTRSAECTVNHAG
jgi:hypothetical protein